MKDTFDPLAASAGIEAGYKRYLKTLLAPRDPLLALAFDTAIDESSLLTKGPLLEATPPYAPGATLADLVEDGTLHRDFVALSSAALPMDRPLYRHQEAAIRKVVAGRNLVVSTGTGSGKTESFLLPILNSLIEERANGTLGPGVRALLLYPMNALANDQLKRLRSLLSATPDITFGRYTGETQPSTRDAISNFRSSNPGEEPLPNEMLSREQMRDSPPHILLTNYAMLEYLLLRPADLELFDGEYSGTWKFIALDEAHVYDGAQGAEVALLLRRLRERVGRARPLQCIATSASLTGRTPESQGVEATTFAHHLFDVPFDFVDGEPEFQDLVTPTRLSGRTAPTWTIDDAQLVRTMDPTMTLDFLAEYGSRGSVAAALQTERRTAELQSALARGPVAASELEERLWPSDPEAGAKLAALVALGSRVQDGAGNPILSARYHMFVRATEGAYISFSDDGPSVLLGRHEIDPTTGRSVFEFGTCQRCGAVHLAGNREVVNGHEYFRPVKREDQVWWLVLTEATGDSLVDEDEETLSDGGGDTTETSIRRLCAGCGALSNGKCVGDGCPGGPSLGVREHKKKSAIMSQCTECGARSRQVIRRLRTDTNAAPAVITTALYQHIPPATDGSVSEVGEGRKLLMFSDSRQAAAFAAPYLEKTYKRMLERRYLTMALDDPQYRGDELSPDDLADYASKKASKAYHFAESATRRTIKRTVNPWVMAELMALDTRQSLEGLGLMGVRLFRSRRTELPPAFEALGLTIDESWGILTELIKAIRLQGAMTLLDDVDIKDEIFDPRSASIYVRSMNSDRSKRIISWLPGGRPGTTNNRIRLARKVVRALDARISEEKFLEGCWRFLLDQGYLRLTPHRTAGDVYQVDHEKLRIVSGTECSWFQCSSCRRLTIHNIRGVCPFGECDGHVNVFVVPAAEDDANHYRYNYRTLRTAPLSAMEHTAQWQSKKAALIQKDFVDGKVNVLSCSTTFELGVDVGDLQAVVLRNMPPKTANYVQRAGRAGRRAASAALVLTYAKRSSHDLSKYQNPESMIAGEMRIPWIPVENERIARRHAHSIALAAYFRNCFENDRETWKNAGEFFAPIAPGQDSPASKVRNFLTPVPDQVQTAIAEVMPPSIESAIGIHDGSWVKKLCDLLDKAEVEMTNDVKTYNDLIDEAVEAKNLSLGSRLQRTLKTIESRQLLGYLANKNILPKYGFPVDTVELRTTHCEGEIGASLELSRDLSQAIYDYAPGNQVVAGGKLWTSRGLQKLPKRELEELKYRTCPSCQQFECGNELDVERVCPSCQQQFGKIRRFVVPEFGFVADRKVEDVKPEPPRRRWGGSTYVENLGDISDPFPWRSVGGVEVLARAGTRARMVVISDGGALGFQLCAWCGWAAPFDTKSSKATHRHPVTDRACEGSTRLVSLGHRYETDVAEFSFGSIAYDKDSVGRWLSVLYALLEGASEALEISRDDIDGTLSWTPDGRRSFVMFDTVPGGAGATKKIAESLEKVILFAVDRVTRCDCGAETSCYGCLRSFRNERYHEQLSRAGALAIFAELKVESSADIVDGPWGESVTLTSQTVVELLLELSRSGIEKPQLGVELGEHYWPVEALWVSSRIVLVEGNDDERDRGLTGEGYTVVSAEATDANDLIRALTYRK